METHCDKKCTRQKKKMRNTPFIFPKKRRSPHATLHAPQRRRRRMVATSPRLRCDPVAMRSSISRVLSSVSSRFTELVLSPPAPPAPAPSSSSASCCTRRRMVANTAFPAVIPPVRRVPAARPTFSSKICVSVLLQSSCGVVFREGGRGGEGDDGV